MPLAHTPYRPQPEPELLGTETISVEDALAGLEMAAVGLTGRGLERPMPVLGSSLVNYRHIPSIVESLREDWQPVPEADRPEAAFVQVHGRVESHMHPCFMGERLVEGLRGAVGSLLLRFNALLKCVPLGFKRLQPAGTHGALVRESPYIHFLIDFLAVGFAPQVGDRLIATLGEVQTARGVNLTVLNTFNAFVAQRDLKPGAWFDADSSTWMVGEDPPKRLYKPSRKLVFRITQPVVESQGRPGPLSFKGVVEGLLPRYAEQGGADDPPVADGPRASASTAPDGSATGRAKRKAEAAGEEEEAPRASANQALDGLPARRAKRKAEVAGEEDAPRASASKAPDGSPAGRAKRKAEAADEVAPRASASTAPDGSPAGRTKRKAEAAGEVAPRASASWAPDELPAGRAKRKAEAAGPDAPQASAPDGLPAGRAKRKVEAAGPAKVAEDHSTANGEVKKPRKKAVDAAAK